MSLVTSTAGTSTALAVQPVAGGFDVLEELHHLEALLVAVLPGGRGHVAVLDVLDRLGVAVDAIDPDIVAALLAQRPDRPDGRIVPAAPDGLLAVARRMRRQPGIGVLRAVLEVAGNADFVLGDLDAGVLGEDLVEQRLAIAADLAGPVGERQQVALAAEIGHHLVDDGLGDRRARAVGGRDRAAEAAAPGHDRHAGILGGREPRPDGRPGEHHVDDGAGPAAGEVLDRGIGLVGTAGGIDHRDGPAVLLGRRGRAGDVAGVVGLVGGDRDDPEQRLICRLGGRAGRTSRDRQDTITELASIILPCRASKRDLTVLPDPFGKRVRASGFERSGRRPGNPPA